MTKSYHIYLEDKCLFKNLNQEEFGRELGIELDRRHSKKKLVKELEDELKKQEE